MLYKGPPIKTGIKLKGKDVADLDPNQVRAYIATLPIKEQQSWNKKLKNKLKSSYEKQYGVKLKNDYAKHAGRPSLDKVPFMKSENDGLPYLPGHSPTCNGRPYATAGGTKKVCKCKYDKWNHEGGSVREVWPGMDIDDFDM